MPEDTKWIISGQDGESAKRAQKEIFARIDQDTFGKHSLKRLRHLVSSLVKTLLTTRDLTLEISRPCETLFDHTKEVESPKW